MTAIQDRTKLIVGIDYGTTYSGKPSNALLRQKVLLRLSLHRPQLRTLECSRLQGCFSLDQVPRRGLAPRRTLCKGADANRIQG